MTKEKTMCRAWVMLFQDRQNSTTHRLINTLMLWIVNQQHHKVLQKTMKGRLIMHTIHLVTFNRIPTLKGQLKVEQLQQREIDWRITKTCLASKQYTRIRIFLKIVPTTNSLNNMRPQTKVIEQTAAERLFKKKAQSAKALETYQCRCLQEHSRLRVW